MNPSYAHDHRTIFTYTDFVELFPGCTLWPQLQDVDHTSPFELSDTGLTVDGALDSIEKMTSPTTFGYRKYGVIALVSKEGAPSLLEEARIPSNEIIRSLFEPLPEPSEKGFGSVVAPDLMARLRCPDCVTDDHRLSLIERELVCNVCQRRYSIKGSTPLFYPQERFVPVEMSASDFGQRYRGLDFERASNYRRNFRALPRNSGVLEQRVLRICLTLLRFLLFPAAFTRHHLSKIGS
jgi:uncharacterized protein YbaR (Trm112 family)